MDSYRASTASFSATTAGTQIHTARTFLGIVVRGAAQCVVYKGNAATGGQEIGYAEGTATVPGYDIPAFGVDVDKAGTPPALPVDPPPPGGAQPFDPGLGGIFVVITGTPTLVLVRYST